MINTCCIRFVLCSVTPAAAFSWRKTITDAAERIRNLNILLKQYAEVARQIKQKTKARKALLAEQKQSAGEAGDGNALSPNYLRLSQAERERAEKMKEK